MVCELSFVISPVACRCFLIVGTKCDHTLLGFNQVRTKFDWIPHGLHLARAYDSVICWGRMHCMLEKIL
jgi:hypothetical protein